LGEGFTARPYRVPFSSRARPDAENRYHNTRFLKGRSGERQSPSRRKRGWSPN
jgi:hypothetical protein